MKADPVTPLQDRPDGLSDASDDASLLRGFVERGDRAAMGLLFTRHADAAYRVALRLCRNSADAEDAVQSAFCEVLRAAATYRGESAVRAWILGFVVNACRHKAREEGRRAVRETRAARPEGVPAGAAGPELREVVRRALDDLPEPYRIPLWLYYGEGLTSIEVADTLGLSENTVRSQLSRGMEQLRTLLAPHGAAVSAAALVAALAAAEAAPPSLAASLAGMVSGAGAVAPAAAAKAGILAKAASGVMTAAVVAGTAAAFWFGTLEPPAERPPDLAWVEERVRLWQPRPEERRFDEIGWARDLRQARRRARELGRLVMVLTAAGPVQLGRTDGGSISLRGGPLSDRRVIDWINRRFVPVYLVAGEYARDGSAPAEEKEEYRRLLAAVSAANLSAGVERLYFFEPGSGKVLESLNVCHVTSESLAARLAELARESRGGSEEPAVAPRPQSAPPPSGPGDLVLHFASRYLDRDGNVPPPGGSYHAFPLEHWVVLGRSAWEALRPPEGAAPGARWELPAAFSEPVLKRLYPLTGNFEDPSGNELREGKLEAELAAAGGGRAWIRLGGRARLVHSFFPGKDPRVVEARVAGFAEWDVREDRVRSLRLVTDGAAYGRDPFGTAVRSAP